jgi:hypothetical protein
MKLLTHGSSLVALLLFVPLAQASVYYVQSVKAPILSNTSFGSPKVAEASKGDALEEVEHKGSWYKVMYKDKTGWVSRLLIGPKPPADRVSVLVGTNENLESGARKRASAFTTAAAARGFAEDRSRVSDKYKSDYAAIERMESVKISDEVAMAFIQEGVGK